MHASIRLATTLAVMIGGVAAQWYSLPFNSSQPVTGRRWLVTHSTGNGIAVFSAIAQRWDLLSPAGSTYGEISDAAVVTREGLTQLRGWSAFTNSSATQSLSFTATFPTPTFFLLNYVALVDGLPGNQGWLRAYSALTNSWASVQLSQPQSTPLLLGTNCAVMRDGLNYHAYSPFTGQWSTLIVPVAGGNPIVGSVFAAVDLHGNSGPFQYAAFSAVRGTWTTSPVYATAGADPVSREDAAACAIKVNIGVANQFRYVAFSPYRAQWVPSSLTHDTAATQNGMAFGNVVRIEDSDPTARYESFSAVTGTWQSLTGGNLTEFGVREDFHIVKQVTSPATSTVFAASALVSGGYQPLPVPDAFPVALQGAHQCLIYGGAISNLQVWSYSAATNLFTGPVPLAPSSTLSSHDAVCGFVVPSSAPNPHAMAFSLRHGNWRQGPLILPGESWTTAAAGGLLAAIRTAPTGLVHVFDEHLDAWLPPVAMSGSAWIPGACLVVNQGATNYVGYSVQRGTWSAVAGIGTTTGPGNVNLSPNVTWFTDSTNQIRVFSASPRAQCWQQFPLSSDLAWSGAAPGGATPGVDVSARGTTSQYGLLYAAIALAPSPITIPGIGGILDLDPVGAIQVADLGFFDADGVTQARIPTPFVVPSFTSLWFQLATFDFATMQIDMADRASGTTFF